MSEFSDGLQALKMVIGRGSRLASKPLAKNLARAGRWLRTGLARVRWMPFFLAPVLVFIGGCSLSSKVSYHDGEGRIPASFLGDIRRNKTEKYWITSNLGEPDYVQAGPQTQEIYTYRFTRASTRHGDLLFVFRYNGAKRETEYFHVFFDDDVVQRYWLDEYAQVQAERYFKEARIEPISTPPPWEPKVDAMPSSPQITPSPSPEPADFYAPRGDEFRL